MRSEDEAFTRVGAFGYVYRYICVCTGVSGFCGKFVWDEYRGGTEVCGKSLNGDERG